MQRRLIAAIAAVVLAGIGAILLFQYVTTADDRAMEGQDPVSVLVVTQPIASGTLGSQMAGSVELQQLPRKAVNGNSLTSLDKVAALATTTNLIVGEQVLESRFAQPGTTSDGAVSVPNNMQLISLTLEAQRSGGGQLAAGDKVAVYVTEDDKTQQILQSVLVVSSGGESSNLLTLAIEPQKVQRVILAAEASRLWLVKEAKDPSATSPLDIKHLIG
jgi:pilus assembly protein CpaB